MAYDRIQEEGSNLTQRSTMNFIGDAVTAVDNAGATRTDVTVAAVKLQATSPGTAQSGHFNIDTGIGRLAVQDKGGQVFNVKAYGATGDGSTDDTTAISNTITAAGAVTPRGVVFFPPGNFKTSGNFDLTGLDGLTIRGSGIQSTTISLSHASNDLFKYCSGSDPADLLDIDITDFSVTVASGTTRTGGWVIKGLSAYNPTSGRGRLRRSRIERIDVKKQVNGFWFNRFENVWVNEVMMSNFVGSGGVGLKAGQTATTNVNQGSNLFLTNVNITGAGFVGSDSVALSIGILVEDCDAVYLVGGGAGAALDNGLKFIAGGHGVFNHFVDSFGADETKNSHAIWITGTGEANTIQFLGCWIASAGAITGGSSSANGLRIDASIVGYGRIVGCHIVNNKGSGLHIDTDDFLWAVSSNTFGGNGSGGTANNNHAMYVDTASGHFGPGISGNYCAGSNGADIRTSSNSNRLQIVGNTWGSATSTAFGVEPDVYIGNSDHGGRCSASVYRTTAQSITHATDTVVTFDAENYDLKGMHSTVSNTGRLTVPASGSGKANKGVFVISAGIEFAPNATGLRQIRFLKNGGTILAYDNRTSVGGSVPTRVSLTHQAELVEGDYVEVRVYQDSGGSLNTGSGAEGVWFTMAKTP